MSAPQMNLFMSILAVVRDDGFPDLCYPDTPEWREVVAGLLRKRPVGTRVLEYKLVGERARVDVLEPCIQIVTKEAE